MRRPKKYQSGEGTQYVTRKQALKRLQLSLNDFRRLCIIKGIYPREPKHRRRAQRGSNDIKILYHAKDIKFLLHEPIVWTLRDYKIFARKSGRDRAIRDFKNLKRRINAYPELKLDHVVKERYPTFIDAIKDLDDCLTLLFLFSTFPSLKLIPRSQSSLCRRLTIEFLHAVISSQCLSKVFISIKGYYFQAEIKGQKVTWIVPHYYPFQPQAKSEVDFKIMSIFVEFYTIMLGFVNFRLYHSLNLAYPPQFPVELLQDNEKTLSNEAAFVSDRIAALNVDLKKLGESTVNPTNEDEEIDYELLEGTENPERMQKLKQEAMEQKRLKNLFQGLKFFLNREIPREPLVVIIRSFGGKVSWDMEMFPGATFNEDDETITHHIVDRPNMEKQYLSRDYVQPQWVFDSVNQRKLLPTIKYFIGVVLPPHLSPFVDPDRDTYIPLEEKALKDPTLLEKEVENEEEVSDDEEDEVEGKEKAIEYTDEVLEKAYEDEKADASEVDEDEDMNAEVAEEDEANETADDKEKKRLEMIKKMSVVEGKLHKENRNLKRKTSIEEHKLQARMVKPRHRNLFRKLLREEKDKEKEAWLLKKKRKNIEAAEKEMKKQKKREERRKLIGKA